jgi:hypothetical protein
MIAVCLLYPGQPMLHWGGLAAFVALYLWDRLLMRRQATGS